MKKNTKSIVAERRRRAEERQAEHNKLTLQEKLAKAGNSFGSNYNSNNSARERARLARQIKEEQDKVLIPVNQDGAPKTRLTPEEKAARKKANKAAKQG